MTLAIIFSYLIGFCLVAFIQYMQPTWLPFIDFSTQEPNPEEGELLSYFKLRKLKNIFSWCLIVIAVFCGLYLMQTYINIPYVHHIILLLALIALIACCVALFAVISFLLSWGRTKLFGPDPVCDFKAIEKFYGG